MALHYASQLGRESSATITTTISIMARGLLTLCVSALAAVASASYPVVKPADVVFVNGEIYTMCPSNSMASAMVVRAGKIEYVGSKKSADKYIGKQTKVIDLKGKMAMPGLVDSHMHVLSGGLFLLKCNLNYQTLSIDDVLKHIQGCIDGETGKTDDDWLEVVNMDYAGLVEKSGSVGKKQLDKLKTKRPIIIRSSDYHTVLANSRALELSKIDSTTKDPSGGKIVRLPGSQEPSGALADGASSLLAGPPPPTDEENAEAGRAALKLLREAGITTFQEAAAGAEHHTLFTTIKAEGGLSARAYFDYRIEAPNTTAAVPALVNDVVKKLTPWHDKSPIGPKPTIKWQAIKAFIDGVITYPANTAALIDPYWAPVNSSDMGGKWAPDKKSLNDPYWKPSVLTKTLELLFLAGFDAQLHVDGDLAVRVGLDAAESFRKKYPRKDFRLGLAHDEVSHEKDWPRFAKLGVDPIVSYQWSQLSSFYIPNTFKSLADYRKKNLQAWAMIEKAGRPLVYGSDWPIDPLDEFLALKVAVTRSGDPENPNSPASQGPPFDGRFPGSGISRTSALRSITINGARFLRADKQIGSLEAGKLADIIILENNFFKVPESKLGRQKVLLTMVGGEVVYVADGQNFGVKAKFPNNDKSSTKLARRTIGGFNGNELSDKAKAGVARLRKRGSTGANLYMNGSGSAAPANRSSMDLEYASGDFQSILIILGKDVMIIQRITSIFVPTPEYHQPYSETGMKASLSPRESFHFPLSHPLLKGRG
ncbi:amidohydrolase ytcJ-like [Fusarium austroafricanum]|uniref:Amidohydrolase ytcJ-like n=1 Tax=Fusarium austroafricanum TaxID=2364996 RepID=A0A8H4KM55_9HYPO|nr:amidohydrolase ytcJ-like [Fusarium austroafricanum]